MERKIQMAVGHHLEPPMEYRKVHWMGRRTPMEHARVREMDPRIPKEQLRLQQMEEQTVQRKESRSQKGPWR